MASAVWYTDSTGTANINFTTAVVNGVATQDILKLVQDDTVTEAYPEVTYFAHNGVPVDSTKQAAAVAEAQAGAPPALHPAAPLIGPGKTAAGSGQSAGVGVIGVGATSVVVAHGLGGLPAYVGITGTGANPGGDFFVTAVTAGSFTVNLSAAAPAGGTNFFWRASVN